MKAYQMKTGMWVKHEGEFKYLKTKSHTMGNVINITLRSEGGGLESVVLTQEQEVEVRQ